MKEILRELKLSYKEDPKDFITSMFGAILIFGFTWFLLWFVGTFCYDM